MVLMMNCIGAFEACVVKAVVRIVTFRVERGHYYFNGFITLNAYKIMKVPQLSISSA